MNGRATSPFVVAAALSWAPFTALAAPALDGLTPVAEVAVGFKNSALDADDGTAKAIARAIAKASRPTCFWIARGESASEAKAVRATLGEAGVTTERVLVEEMPAAASAQAYCDAPSSIVIAFPPGKATLDARARDDLDLTALLMRDAPPERSYIIQGIAGADESDDPVHLALERTIVARAWLVAQGVAAARLTFKSIEGNTPQVIIALGRKTSP